jgi:hypothetical protein
MTAEEGISKEVAVARKDLTAMNAAQTTEDQTIADQITGGLNKDQTIADHSKIVDLANRDLNRDLVDRSKIVDLNKDLVNRALVDHSKIVDLNRDHVSLENKALNKDRANREGKAQENLADHNKTADLNRDHVSLENKAQENLADHNKTADLSRDRHKVLPNKDRRRHLPQNHLTMNE